MNRSSWASGSSNVPDCSTGFCVAMTRNGTGSLNVWPPMVTLRSCMASSIALWAFGAARLISSASSRLVKIGPFCTRKSPVFWSRISEPTMSDGSMSMVNWMRENVQVDGLGHGVDQQRLGQSRHALQHQVAAGEQGDQDPFDHRVLADDHLRHAAANVVAEAVGAVKRRREPVSWGSVSAVGMKSLRFACRLSLSAGGLSFENSVGSRQSQLQGRLHGPQPR